MKRKTFLIAWGALSILLSACSGVEVVEEDPVYMPDESPAFTTGVITLSASDPQTAPVLTRAVSLPSDFQTRDKVQSIVKRQTYVLTPEAAAEVFQTPEVSPNEIKLSQEQIEHLMLNDLSTYRKYMNLHNHKVELELSLSEIAEAYGRNPNDYALFSSLEYFKTYVSYRALCLEMKRLIYDIH